MIDFGVAKATDQRLTEQTMFTQFGQVIGTLEYMSPEQAEIGIARHRHSERHLFAGGDAVRVVDGKHAPRACQAAAGSLRGNPAAYSRRGAAQAEHALERFERHVGHDLGATGRPSRHG